MEKKSWETPQLIVLVRSKPEEAVLLTCKGGSPGGPGNQFGNCEEFGEAICHSCDSIATS